MTPLSLLHLSPLLSSLRLLLSYSSFSIIAFCLSCNRLNPDRHCPSVVMTTIWRSLSVANCGTDIYFFTLLCVSSLCRASLGKNRTTFSLMVSHWCCTSVMRAGVNRNRWLMSHEILLFLFWHLIIFLCPLCFTFRVDGIFFFKKAIYRHCCSLITAV